MYSLIKFLKQDFTRGFYIFATFQNSFTVCLQATTCSDSKTV